MKRREGLERWTVLVALALLGVFLGALLAVSCGGLTEAEREEARAVYRHLAKIGALNDAQLAAVLRPLEVGGGRVVELLISGGVTLLSMLGVVLGWRGPVNHRRGIAPPLTR